MKKILFDERGEVDLGSLFVGVLIMILVNSFILFLFSVYVTFTIDSREYEIVKIAEREIYAMQDGNSVSGTFLRGTGSIQTGINYNYYIKNEDGTVSQGTVNSKDVKLVFIKEGETPKIEKYEKDFGKFYNFFARSSSEEHVFYYIYVPEGSVVEEFKLDAQ